MLEYETYELDLTRNQAAALQRTGFVTVSPVTDDRWLVTASSYVGSLAVEGIELLIRPKINPENLFLLLEPGLPANSWLPENFDYDSSTSLISSVIGFFARTVETALGRGVLRSYEARAEQLVALRGRLDVAGQFRQAGVLTPLACTYDEFSEDVVENRALRAAIRLALRVPRVAPDDRQRLMRQLVALESVADVSVSTESIDAIHLTRLNRHYAPALGLARLILANLTLTDAHGATSAPSFMVDMNDLFQRFVTERLRRALQGRLEVVAEPTVHLGLDRQVSMRPDLVFRNLDGSARYVGDIKYKLALDARGRSSDYYQLLAYTTAMDLPEGVLVYCRRHGEPGHRPVTVKNSGKRLVLRSIDLTGPAQEVDDEIESLADAIVDSLTRVQ
ncbi:McrC family protein [Rhodococcus sp. SJ-2]